MRFDTKIAVVLRSDLAVWQKTNVTAFLVSGIVATVPDVVGQPYRDASGNEYLRCSSSRCSCMKLRSGIGSSGLDQLPMSLFRASSTADLEPAACPNPAQTGACPIRGGDFIPDVAVDSANGKLYAVWMDARFSFFQTGAFRWDSIAYSQSSDGGRTWSPAIQVNATPPGSNQNSQAFTPSVAVGSDGAVTVTYYDFRNNTPSPATLDTTHWASHCHPASENCANPASWNEETQVSPTFNIREAPFARGYFIGDYMGLDFGGGFATAWGSTLGGGPSSIFSNTLTP